MATIAASHRTVTGTSWHVITSHPYLLFFPIVAFLLDAAIWLVGSYQLIMYAATSPEPGRAAREHAVAGDSGFTMQQIVVLIVAFVVMLYLYTLVNQLLFGALVKCADEELQGRPAGIGTGLAAAFRRLPALMGWAVIQTAVNYVFRLIEGTGPNNVLVVIMRTFLAFLAMVAWYTVTLFVLPLIMLRGKGPVEALRESFHLIRQTWGRRTVRGCRIGGGIWFFIGLAGLGVMMLGNLMWNSPGEEGGVGLIVTAFGWLVVLVGNVFINAMYYVFGTALLHYVEDGDVVGPFDVHQLAHAASPRS